MSLWGTLKEIMYEKLLKEFQVHQGHLVMSDSSLYPLSAIRLRERSQVQGQLTFINSSIQEDEVEATLGHTVFKHTELQSEILSLKKKLVCIYLSIYSFS